MFFPRALLSITKMPERMLPDRLVMRSTCWSEAQHSSRVEITMPHEAHPGRLYDVIAS